MSEDAQSLLRGLKAVKNVYVQCPFCTEIFSLHSARLIHGKAPPKDFLSKAQRRVDLAIQRMQRFEERYETEKDDWEQKVSDTEYDWENKLAIKSERWKSQETMMKEKLRHLKSDIAAAQKEVIREKVDKALQRQRGVIEGHIAELFPMFRRTRINPADICALVPTSPIDFIAFEGLFQKNVENILFFDVKKGESGLTRVQRSIRDCIEEGNVDFKKIRVNFNRVRGRATEE